MNNELERYLYEDEEAYYINCHGEKYKQSVHGKSYVRYNEAKKQAENASVDIEIIINYVKVFLKKVGIKTAENPVMNPELIDYVKMQKEFELEDQRDLIWMKFTEDGYLGVVATSNDINFDIPHNANDYDRKHKVYNAYLKKYEDDWVHNSSGIIVHKLGKRWDKTFVLVFPLKDIPIGYTRGDVEKAVGNMLKDNNVPILDCYSHLY